MRVANDERPMPDQRDAWQRSVAAR